jgi:aspartate/methionine/tyrosine aminotransferase
MSSEYMEWVKTQTGGVAFNLANSGLKNYPLSELPVDFGSLTLSGAGAYGYPPLKTALALKSGVHEDCVTTALGTSMANYLAMAATLEAGDEVVMEYPSYSLLWETAEYLGAKVKFFPRLPLDLDALQAAITKHTRLIVLTNLHNPSCGLLDLETLTAIGEMALEAGAHVLVDEVYLDLLHDSAPPSAFHLGSHFIATNSLTKVYGLSGLRCGWVLADPTLTKKMLRINDLLGVNNPYITDQISCVALANLPQIADWSKGVLEANRKVANGVLAGCPHMLTEPLEVGTVLFPKLLVPVEEFCKKLRQRYDTVVTPGHFFGAPEHVRLAIGGESSVVIGGFSRVREALASF